MTKTWDKMLVPLALTLSLGILLSVKDVTSTSPVSVESQTTSKYKNLGKNLFLYWRVHISFYLVCIVLSETF